MNRFDFARSSPRPISPTWTRRSRSGGSLPAPWFAALDGAIPTHWRWQSSVHRGGPSRVRFVRRPNGRF